MGNATTVGTTVVATISGPMTVTGSVGISGPVTVTGTVAATQSGSWALAGPVTVTGSVAIAGPVTVAGSISASSLILLGESVSPGTTVVGAVAVAKRVDDATATVGSTVGGAVAIQTDAFGNLRVINAATTVATISGPMTVTGSVGISGPVTVTGSVTSAITGPVTVTGSVSAVGQVSIAGNVAISGPVTVSGSVTATLAAGTATNEVVGDVAHGVAAAGNPVLVGIEGRSTDGTAVDSGDVTRALATLLGKLVNHPYAIPAQYTSFANVTAGLATTVAATAFASAGASTRWYITSAQFINQGAAVTRAHLQDGAGALYYTASLATGGGGVSASFPVPIRIAANQTVEIKLDTTGTTVFTNLQGYKASE